LSAPLAATTAGADQRALGFWMCTALVVGNIIGVGIFVMPAALAPYGLNAVSGWGVTVIGCLFLAIVLSGLARAFPKEDGPYAYITRAFGETPAFLVMWCYWVSVPVANAAIAIGAVGYLGSFFPALTASPGWSAAAAIAAIWFFILINLRGARLVGGVQVFTTVLKVLPQLAVVLLGLWLLVRHPGRYVEHVPQNPASFSQVSEVLTLTLFAMLGIECATIPAGRVRSPETTIPRATLAGTLIASLLYCGVSIVPMLLIPQAQLAASNAPFADLFSREMGGQYGSVLALFIVVSALGALNGWTLIIADLTQTMARHRGFPRALSRENSRGAPSLALLVYGVITSLMLLVNYSDSIAKGFAFLITVATAANLPIYYTCSIAYFVLRRRGEIRSSGRAWLQLAVCVLATAYCVWASIGIGLRPLLWTLALGGAGVPIYLWSLYTRRSERLAAPA
jgi:APA family basic amino acid/polyamine antiporter